MEARSTSFKVIRASRSKEKEGQKRQKEKGENQKSDQGKHVNQRRTARSIETTRWWTTSQHGRAGQNPYRFGKIQPREQTKTSVSGQYSLNLHYFVI